MKEVPFLFNTDMVKSILEGRKTNTRRIAKNIPIGTYRVEQVNENLFEAFCGTYEPEKGVFSDFSVHIKPPCQVGDVIWVRETWFENAPGGITKYFYKADKHPEEVIGQIKAFGYKWRPSIHMPRSAARLFLKVKNVRVERIRDISAEDIRNEGLTSAAVHCLDYEIAIKEFEILWNSIYKNWNESPWVWVIEFERMNEDE